MKILLLEMISITIFLHVPHEIIFPCKCLFTSRARKCFTFCMTIDMSFHAIQRWICAEASWTRPKTTNQSYGQNL